ncbi:MAG TPA: M1 family aminopeptidase [Candidatus Limnocylindrales bacterium]|nr:M1 family aminopeptidase [Candidatus Limnocylindrales bacterium]
MPAQVPDVSAPPGQQDVPTEPRALYQALNALRPDTTRVYSVRSVTLRRDVINLTLDDGKLAFFRPLGGQVTGIVFVGQGHVIATPHDPGERRSLAQFVGVPILDQSFSRAYLRFDDDTAGEVEKELRDSGAVATADPTFGGDWETLCANVNPWHSLRILVDRLSTEPIPYFYAGILSNAMGPMDMLVDGRRYEQVLFGQPRRSEGSQSYDIWASFHAMGSATAPENFVPVDYRIETNIADDLSLDGVTALHVRVARGGQRVVPVELSRNLAVSGVKESDGQPLIYFQNEDLSQRQIARRGNDTVFVILPAPARAGDEIHLVIAYHGSVISDAGNGVQYVGEHQNWYAHLAGIDHFVPFDLNFRWPKRFVLVATGTKVESKDDGDFMTGHWRSDVPFVVAGFNLGQYETQTAGDGSPAIDLYANRQLENAILARLAERARGIPLMPPSVRPPFVNSLPDPTFEPSPAGVLNNLGKEIRDAIHFYETLNGPFPFRELDVSQIPGTVGQGWPGLVYLSTYAFLPPEAGQRAGITERSQALARDIMPFHEVAHQWWGNVTVSASYRDVWIQEGMANYLSLLYADSRKSKDRMSTWLERYRSELTARAPLTGETIEESGPLTLGYRLESSKNLNAYDTVIYDKGTWVMHMIRELLWDPRAKDPDARFHTLLQSILTQYRFQPLSTADFQRAVEAEMTPSMDLEGGHSMNWFFDEWVKATGIPHYTVQFEAKPHGKEFLVTGKLEQDAVDDVFTAPVPLYAVRSGEKPEHLGVVVTTGPETRFRFVSRFRPSRLAIDPQLTLLCVTD